MDKFIKVDNFKLLCDPKKIKSKRQKLKREGKSNLKFIDKSYLNTFKKFICTKIEKFIPNQSKDEFDILILSLWHQFIFKNVDNSKYYEFVNILNDNVKENNIENNIQDDINTIDIDKIDVSLNSNEIGTIFSKEVDE